MQYSLTINRTYLGWILCTCLLLVWLVFESNFQMARAADGAKNLFYRQIEQPSSSINTGLQYWIELKRGGKVQNVSNKFAFKSGDKIRIHVKSNIDGYAYVMLLEGSRGEHSVLFPDSHFHDNNKVRSNHDIPIPAEGYLAFDQNPGTEKLVLLLSRTQLDAAKYIADKARTRVQIAALPNGSKDLIPGSVVLAYADQDSNGANTGQSSAQSTTASSNSVDKQDSNKLVANNENSDNPAVTTLIQKNPEEVLAVDVALMHQP